MINAKKQILLCKNPVKKDEKTSYRVGENYKPLIQQRDWSLEYILKRSKLNNKKEAIQLEHGLKTRRDISQQKKKYRDSKKVHGKVLNVISYWKMQIKTTMRPHYAPIRIVKT